MYVLDFTFAITRILDQLDRMLGSAGFQSAKDVAAITVNRWNAYTHEAIDQAWRAVNELSS